MTIKAESLKVPVSILVPTLNEEKNLGYCLKAVADWADEIVVVDSSSTDKTEEIAKQYRATFVHFEFNGGWPKKKQWALDNYPFRNEWILILDADEVLLPGIKKEIEKSISNSGISGYYLVFQMEFLGKKLKFSYPGLKKLVLFRKNSGRFERRLYEEESQAEMKQNITTGIEIHEHFLVEGKTGVLKSPVLHRNNNSLTRYIAQFNEYSSWESKVLNEGNVTIVPSLFGSQAQRRRWMKINLLGFPGISFLYFLYNFIFKLGFLDGKAGYYFCLFKMNYMIETKAKLFEIKVKKREGI